MSTYADNVRGVIRHLESTIDALRADDDGGDATFDEQRALEAVLYLLRPYDPA